jgi:hypothetical protein
VGTLSRSTARLEVVTYTIKSSEARVPVKRAALTITCTGYGSRATVRALTDSRGTAVVQDSRVKGGCRV